MIVMKASQSALSKFHHYYTLLYISKQPLTERFEEFFAAFVPPELSLDQQNILNPPITLNEVMNVIDTLKSAKAPGLDGLTSKFYKMFKFTLAPKSHRIYKSVLEDYGCVILVERCLVGSFT